MLGGCTRRPAFTTACASRVLAVIAQLGQLLVEDFDGGPADREARDQRKRLRPIRARVAGNRGLPVTRRAPLPIARLGWPAAVEPGPVAPLRIEFDSVGRVRHHQQRPTRTEQPRDPIGFGRISTPHPMWLPTAAAQPQIPRTGDGIFRQRRSHFLALLLREREEVIDLMLVETCQAEIDIRRAQIL